MTRLVLLGPPGVGKGTQAMALSQHLGVPAISTGDIFRQHVAEGTRLGQVVQQHLDAGEYVPDAVTNEVVRERLRRSDTDRGFILDGYPRTAQQVGELDDTLATDGWTLDHVISMAADTDELVRRLADRAVRLGRSDDTADVIRNRQHVYLAQTAPLTASYEQRGLLRKVDGQGEVEDITERILARILSGAPLPTP